MKTNKIRNCLTEYRKHPGFRTGCFLALMMTYMSILYTADSYLSSYVFYVLIGTVAFLGNIRHELRVTKREKSWGIAFSAGFSLSVVCELQYIDSHAGTGSPGEDVDLADRRLCNRMECADVAVEINSRGLCFFIIKNESCETLVLDSVRHDNIGLFFAACFSAGVPDF